MTPSIFLRALIFVLLLTIVFRAFAQDRLTAPRIGATLTSDGTVQNIQGVPGAARFVPDLDTTPYSALYVASHAPVMLAITPKLAVLAGTTTTRVPIDALPHIAALSPKGLYFALAIGDALRIFDSPGTPAKPLDLASIGFQPDDSLDLALSDDGSVLIAGPTSIAFTSASRDPIVSAPLSLLFPRFAPGSNLAVAYDRRDNALVLIHTDTLVSERLLAFRDGLSLPSGLEFANPNTLWISQSGQNSVLKYSLETRSAVTYPLLQPGALRATGTPGIYFWTDGTLLDTARSTPQVLLISTPEAQ